MAFLSSFFLSLFSLAAFDVAPPDDHHKPPADRDGRLAPDTGLELIYAGKRVGDWVELLDGSTPSRRQAAARALGEIGPGAAAAVPSLRRALDDPFVRSQAAIALGSIGPAAESALPDLMRLLEAADYFNQGLIEPAIAGIGPAAVAPLARILEADKSNFRIPIIQALGRIRPPATAAVPRLKALLADDDAKVRLEAASALWKIARDKAAIPVMTAGLKDGNETVRMFAAGYLAELGVDARPALHDLILALSDRDPAVLNRAAAAVGGIGPEAKDAVPALMRAAGGPNLGFGQYASTAAVQIGPAAVPSLVEALDDRDIEVRGTAILTLRLIGRDARQAVPGLQRVLRRAEVAERLRAASALWHIERDRAMIRLIIDTAREGEGLARGDTDLSTRYAALYALEDIGPPAKDAVPLLLDYLKSDNGLVRSRAARVLGTIGPAAAVAVPALEASLADPKASTRAAAAVALWRIARAPSALTATVKDLRSPDESNLFFALDAIREIGPEAEVAVPVLIQTLRHAPQWYQTSVVEALAKIGAGAKPALPALTEAFNDEGALHREEIAAAIKSIESAAGPKTP